MTYSDLSQELQDAYAWLDPASKLAPLKWDGTGEDRVLRFKANQAITWVHDVNDGLSLNKLWVAAHREHWLIADMMELYRQMGYSLSGFGDIFYDRIKSRRKKF